MRRSGRRYVGLCPFHHETAPSFSVNPEGQFFYCFGCKASGDAFEFIMQIEGLDFPSAAKLLAERSSVKWETQTPDEEARERRRTALFKLNAVAAEVYRRALNAPRTGERARTYLLGRSLKQEAWKRFGLGYAPGGKLLVNVFRKHGRRLEEAADLGLILPTGGGFYDRFRERLIFPLADPRGRIVGFGGRVIGTGQPKYLNSQESELFSKGRFLYGFHLARESIRRSGQAILVEGYLDVITAHAAGIANVLATLGTSLTAHHAQLLSRFASEVIMAYDGDSAGQAATLRGMEILRRQGLRIRVAVLPPDTDPDDLIRREGADSFTTLVAAALPLTEFLLESSLADADLSNPDGRSDAVQACLPVLAEVASATARDAYIRKIAARVRVHEDTVAADLSSFMQKHRHKRHIMDNNREDSNTNRCMVQLQDSSPNPAEKELLRAILKEYSLMARIREKLKPDDFSPGVLREIFRTIYEWHGTIDGSQLLGTMNEQGRPALSALMAEAQNDQGPPMKEDSLPKCIGRIRIGALRRKLMEIDAQLNEASTEEQVRLMSDYQTLLVELREEQFSSFGGIKDI